MHRRVRGLLFSCLGVLLALASANDQGACDPVPVIEECRETCAERECGADGCGGVCGICGDGERCVAGLCQCSDDPGCASEASTGCDDGSAWHCSRGTDGCLDRQLTVCEGGCAAGSCVSCPSRTRIFSAGGALGGWVEFGASHTARVYSADGALLQRVVKSSAHGATIHVFGADGALQRRVENDERVFDGAGRLLGRMEGERWLSADGALQGTFRSGKLFSADGALTGWIEPAAVPQGCSAVPHWLLLGR